MIVLPIFVFAVQSTPAVAYPDLQLSFHLNKGETHVFNEGIPMRWVGEGSECACLISDNPWIETATGPIEVIPKTDYEKNTGVVWKPIKVMVPFNITDGFYNFSITAFSCVDGGCRLEMISTGVVKKGVLQVGNAPISTSDFFEDAYEFEKAVSDSKQREAGLKSIQEQMAIPSPTPTLVANNFEISNDQKILLGGLVLLAICGGALYYQMRKRKDEEGVLKIE